MGRIEKERKKARMERRENNIYRDREKNIEVISILLRERERAS